MPYAGLLAVGPTPNFMGWDRDNAPVSVAHEYRDIKRRFDASSQGSRHGEFDVRFLQLERELWKLSGLRDGWDSYGAPAPSAMTIQHAFIVLRKVLGAMVEPRGVGASAEGGVAIYFINGDRYAHLEILNSGEFAAVMYEGDGEPRTLDIPDTDQALLGAIRALKGYIR